MKKSLLKIALLTLVYVCISLGIYLLLKRLGYANVGKIRDFISKFGVWSYLIFFLLQIIVSTFICVIPFEDEVLTMSAILLFGPFKAFFVSAFNMFVTSCIQFALGRFLCKDIVVKILGDSSMEKYQNYLRVKGEIMLPILYAIPLLPHDSLCILAGMSKMKFWYFAPITIVMRSIEIVSLCFLGSGLINFSTFTIADWIMFVNLLIIDLILLFKLYKYLDSKFNK